MLRLGRLALEPVNSTLVLANPVELVAGHDHDEQAKEDRLENQHAAAEDFRNRVLDVDAAALQAKIGALVQPHDDNDTPDNGGDADVEEEQEEKLLVPLSHTVVDP